MDLMRVKFTTILFAGICSTPELAVQVCWTRRFSCHMVELDVRYPLICYCQLRVEFVLLTRDQCFWFNGNKILHFFSFFIQPTCNNLGKLNSQVVTYLQLVGCRRLWMVGDLFDHCLWCIVEIDIKGWFTSGIWWLSRIMDLHDCTVSFLECFKCFDSFWFN